MSSDGRHPEPDAICGGWKPPHYPEHIDYYWSAYQTPVVYPILVPSWRGFYTIRQVLLPTGTLGVLASGADGRIYQLWAGDPATSVVQATAITQPLPLPGSVQGEVWGTRKLFKMLYVEGQDLTNFDVSYSYDGGHTWNGPKILHSKTK